MVQFNTNLIFVAVLIMVSLVSSGAYGEKSTDRNETQLWETVKDAYIYSFPLVLMDATMEKRTNTVDPTDKQAPVNQFYYGDTLDDANSKDVVTPNVDTIYAEAYLDLNDTALVFVKPQADRFCSAQVMDAYSNTIDVLGSGGGSEDPEAEEIALITGRNYPGDIPEGMTRISVPTDIAWIVVRIECYGPEDLPNITAIQEQIVLVPLEIYLDNKTYVPEKGVFHEELNFTPVDHVMNMSPEEFFNTANRLMVTNPPAPEDLPIIEEMKTVNVGPGLLFDEGILEDNTSEQWKDLLESMTPEKNNYYVNFSEKMGNWMYYPKPIGEWGTDYPYRAMIAFVAFGANPTYVAIYPGLTMDSRDQHLTGKNRYLLHFDRGMLPPVLAGGFWSVTAYGEESFLIPNEIGRYCINDRSNVTYNPDGSMDIILQAEAPEPSLENNWLPIGTDSFHLVMRMYLPDMDSVTGDWTAPMILKQEG